MRAHSVPCVFSHFATSNLESNGWQRQQILQLWKKADLIILGEVSHSDSDEHPKRSFEIPWTTNEQNEVHPKKCTRISTILLQLGLSKCRELTITQDYGSEYTVKFMVCMGWKGGMCWLLDLCYCHLIKVGKHFSSRYLRCIHQVEPCFHEPRNQYICKEISIIMHECLDAFLLIWPKRKRKMIPTILVFSTLRLIIRDVKIVCVELLCQTFISLCCWVLCVTDV